MYIYIYYDGFCNLEIHALHIHETDYIYISLLLICAQYCIFCSILHLLG